jgi:hypothetical protein
VVMLAAAKVFLGYSYFRSVPSPAAGNRMKYLNGGTASVVFHFSEHLALAGAFASYGDDQLDLSGTSVNTSRTVDFGGHDVHLPRRAASVVLEATKSFSVCARSVRRRACE